MIAELTTIQYRSSSIREQIDKLKADISKTLNTQNMEILREIMANCKPHITVVNVDYADRRVEIQEDYEIEYDGYLLTFKAIEDDYDAYYCAGGYLDQDEMEYNLNTITAYEITLYDRDGDEINIPEELKYKVQQWIEDEFEYSE